METRYKGADVPSHIAMEKKARFVAFKRRQEIGNQLLTHDPSVMEGKLFQAADKRALAARNRTDLPSAAVLQQISSGVSNVLALLHIHYTYSIHSFGTTSRLNEEGWWAHCGVKS